jgi:division protein 1
VEDHVCLTGGADGNVRLWDLRRIDEVDTWRVNDMLHLSVVAEGDDTGEFGELGEGASSSEQPLENETACVRLLGGHTQAVTALYFEDECLVCIL